MGSRVIPITIVVGTAGGRPDDTLREMGAIAAARRHRDRVAPRPGPDRGPPVPRGAAERLSHGHTADPRPRRLALQHHPATAHDVGQGRTTGDCEEWRTRPVEITIGILLVVISAIEIIGIVRVVSGNLNIGR